MVMYPPFPVPVPVLLDSQAWHFEVRIWRALHQVDSTDTDLPMNSEHKLMVIKGKVLPNLLPTSLGICFIGVLTTRIHTASFLAEVPLILLTAVMSHWNDQIGAHSQINSSCVINDLPTNVN